MRDHSGLGITISYWESLEAIENWKQNVLHKEAKKEVVSNGTKTSTYVSALLRKNLSFIEILCRYEEKLALIAVHEIYGVNDHMHHVTDHFTSSHIDVFCPNLLQSQPAFPYSDEEKAYHFL